jgi:hypothetical protein
VDFWEKYSFEDLKLMHEERMYPPVVTVLVYTSCQDVMAAVTLVIDRTRNDEVPSVEIMEPVSKGRWILLPSRVQYSIQCVHPESVIM